MGGSLGVSNPLEELTQEQFEEGTGLFLPLPEESFSQIAWQRINVAPEPVYSLQFVYAKDGNGYTLRLCRETEEVDISGMYYDWITAEIGDAPEGSQHLGYTAYWNEEGQGICLWEDEAGTKYSLAMEQNATRDALVEMYRLLVQSMTETE